MLFQLYTGTEDTTKTYVVYDFKKDGNLYFREYVDTNTISLLKSNIRKAQIRVDSFWLKKNKSPQFIYCQNDEDYKKFGAPYMSPACANMVYQRKISPIYRKY